jgi:hypothetical protein
MAKFVAMGIEGVEPEEYGPQGQRDLRKSAVQVMEP